MTAPIAVGFDLDLTLVDSRQGIAATYRALSELTGVFIDAEAAVARLGPPLEEEVSRWFPADQVAARCDEFRALYPRHAVTASPILPGAAESVAAVRGFGGRVVVITGKYAPNARLHLDHLGLMVDALVGWTWAESKATAIVEHRLGVYVGDHPADMAAARKADVVGVGVTTGGWSAEQLIQAGAQVVLADLTGFPLWLVARQEAFGEAAA